MSVIGFLTLTANAAQAPGDVTPDNNAKVIRCDIASPASDSLMDGRTAVALLSLIVAGLSILLSRRDRTDALRQSVVDDFWLRQVFAPLCIDPLITFASQTAEQLKELQANGSDQAKFVEFIGEVQSECNTLRARASMIAALDEELERIMVTRVEELEDAIVQHCAEPRNRERPGPDIQQQVALIVRAMCESLIAAHHTLRRKARGKASPRAQSLN